MEGVLSTGPTPFSFYVSPINPGPQLVLESRETSFEVFSLNDSTQYFGKAQNIKFICSSTILQLKLSREKVISDVSLTAEYVMSYGKIKNLNFTGYFGVDIFEHFYTYYKMREHKE